MTLGVTMKRHRDMLESSLSSRYIFALENIFDHDLGPRYRNELAHGMAGMSDFYSKSMIYGIWMMFSLTVLTLSGNWNEVRQILESEVGLE